ncbi:MAG: glucose-1-phosphate adenylyltransferase [Candidatus Fermentibacteraceae bacterium]|nr:glucose-1-phosphate adenylyltransferase [Candidatus Fermentibacteraceae bacterium]MBN2609253.1 glucose-1-phosphate adenylyltransferase [Candidatus Fermentibacteraceae bacterium]
MSRIIAVVLGGGRGTRLYPLTRDRSKPAVPIGGKYRLIDIPLSNCINDQIRHILVLTQYNSESLNRHVARTYRFDRFTHGFVSILAAEQTDDNTGWFQGTADAVRQSLKYINGQHPDLVLILSGDQLYRLDFNRLADYHVGRNADISIATKPVTAADATSLGIMKVGDDGVITEFREKPQEEELDGLRSEQTGTTCAKPFLGNMGIYMFSPGILREVLEREPDVIDFGKEIIPHSIGSYRVLSYPFDGYWSDIGTIGNFFRANLDMAAPEPEFDMYRSFSPLYTSARALPGARVNDCSFSESIVCDASDVEGSRFSRCILGLRGKVRSGTVMENCVFMGSDYWEGHYLDPRNHHPDMLPLGVGRDCLIRNAIIDKNARIGDGCRLENAAGVEEYTSDLYCIRDGIIVIPKNAVLEDGFVI